MEQCQCLFLLMWMLSQVIIYYWAIAVKEFFIFSFVISLHEPFFIRMHRWTGYNLVCVVLILQLIWIIYLILSLLDIILTIQIYKHWSWMMSYDDFQQLDGQLTHWFSAPIQCVRCSALFYSICLFHTQIITYAMSEAFHLIFGTITIFSFLFPRYSNR